MEPTTEPADGDSGQPAEPTSLAPGEPAVSEAGEPAAPEPAEPAAPEPTEAAPGRKQSLAVAFDEHRTLFVLGGIAALVLVTVVAVVVSVLVSNARSTASIRVITPAPATAGGLHRDYRDEAGPEFKSIVSQFRKQFTSPVVKHVTSYAAAIYSNATGSTSAGASVEVFYLGINAYPSIDPARAFSFLGPFESTVTFPSRLVVTGLPGDAKGECFGRTMNGRPVALCLLATDNTATFLISLLPANVSELANLLQKMRPDLQSG